jgi:hypothetical protein
MIDYTPKTSHDKKENTPNREEKTTVSALFNF